MPIFQTFAPNVLYTDEWGAGYKLNLGGLKPSEHLYFQKVFRKLQAIMGSAFWSWRFYTLNAFPEQQIDELDGLPDDRCGRVLFYLSDESSSVPALLLRQFDVIFKSYIADPAVLPDRIVPLQLGTVNTLNDIDQRPNPFPDRATSVFFSGNLNDNRLKVARALAGDAAVNTWRYLNRRGRIGPLQAFLLRLISTRAAQQIRGSRIRFTPGFLSGMPCTEYWAALANSKIAICPKGYRSAETFRHYEATKMGCVVVTDQLPSTNLYRSEHFVVIQDWSRVVDICTDLLHSGESLERLSRQAAEHWETTMSENACARSIADTLSILGRGLTA